MSEKEPLKRSSSSRVFMDGFNDMFTQWLPGQEKVMKQAFYNAVAVLFIALAIVASIAVYLVLQPFLRPLLWAVLFGSALHPFKQQLTRVTKQWLSEVQATNTPLVIGAIILPFNIINWSLNGLISIVKQYAKLLLFIFVALLSTHLCLYYFTFTHLIITFMKDFTISATQLFGYLLSWCNFWVITSFAVTHLLAVTFWFSNETHAIIEKVSPFIWITMAIKVVQSLGTFGIFAAVIIISLVLTGVVGSLFVSESGSSTNGDETDSVRQISSQLLSVIFFIWNSLKSLLPSHPKEEQYLLETPSEERTPCDVTDVSDSTVSSTVETTVPESSPNFQSNEDDMNLNSYSQGHNQNFSNGCLYALLWSCLLAQIWLRPHIIYLLSIPLALITFKWLFERLNSSEFLAARLHTFKGFFESRKEAIFNYTIRTFYQYLVIGDRMICESLQKSTDSLCSLFVIFVMVICTLFATVFLAIQVYHESTHLMFLTGNLVNSTLVNNPELSQLLPVNFIERTMIDEMMANAYVYGRGWIKNNIYIIGNNEADVNASRAVEKQILEVWDRVYHLWLNRSENLTKYDFEQKFFRTKSFEAYNWDKLFGALKSLNFALLFNLLKENIDVIVSVFDSVWSLLKGNITLLFTSLTAILSLLLHGSSAILNMFLSLIVFSTSLFYLLCSSGEQYRPIELASRSMPIFSYRKSKNKFGQAVEEAINSVFAASFKMMAFYGLYTWLTHTLFEVQMVFIPSVLAAVFGAVPFIGAYWASLPAVIELWLVTGSGYRSFFMALFAMLPSYFVDCAVYSDIKGGGHPYLTGLAIAGGVFYLGFEGALFGPILLCCLFVVGKMYSSIMSDTPLTPSNPLMPSKAHQLKRQQTTIN